MNYVFVIEDMGADAQKEIGVLKAVSINYLNGEIILLDPSYYVESLTATFVIFKKVCGWFLIFYAPVTTSEFPIYFVNNTYDLSSIVHVVFEEFNDASNSFERFLEDFLLIKYWIVNNIFIYNSFFLLFCFDGIQFRICINMIKKPLYQFLSGK